MVEPGNEASIYPSIEKNRRQFFCLLACLLVKDGALLLLPAELPESGGWEVEEGEVGRRRDLRETHLVFSIDPQGCEDVDDTLSVRY